MNPLVHFELPVTDLKKASDFYTKTFGWTITPWKSPDGKLEYWSIVTKDKDGNGINGGMMKRQNPGHVFCNYVAVEDIDATLRKITAGGGKTCMGKTEIAPGMGWIAMFSDPDGNFMGLHQAPLNMKKSAPKAAKKTAAKKTAKKK